MIKWEFGRALFEWIKQGFRVVRLYLKGILYEYGEPSLTRFIALTSYLLFAGASLYLMVTGKRWDDYGTFASITGGGGLATQVVNKLTNSINNSDPGVYITKKNTTKVTGEP